MATWLKRPAWPSAVGRLDLVVMSSAYAIFGLSLLLQGHRRIAGTQHPLGILLGTRRGFQDRYAAT